MQPQLTNCDAWLCAGRVGLECLGRAGALGRLRDWGESGKRTCMARACREHYMHSSFIGIGGRQCASLLAAVPSYRGAAHCMPPLLVLGMVSMLLYGAH
jgi:hypothetical protein